jgi:glycerophosphoryl diester phosphodiesterase
MFSLLPTPTLFAHRGASAYAPENTLAAFELAVQQGMPAIELDAKLTADGQVVVIHDQSVDRTTDGTGLVRNMPLSELRTLDAGSHFDISFQGEGIPTLSDVFEAVGQRILINIELTNYASIFDSLSEKVVHLVRHHNLVGRVMFSSFNPFALTRARRLEPEIPLGLLAIPGAAGAWARGRLGRLVHYAALHPEIRDVTPSLVKAAHARGERVFVYTVNQIDDMRRLFHMGADGIFTDDPLLAQQALQAQG